MKVSVIIPCYNEEKYLDNCLSTLSTQSLPPDEVILCDNNSTDNSLKIASKYFKTLPLKIVKQPIKGIIPTAEKAWRSSTGDIIIRTDADSSFPKDWINNIIKHFQSDPELAACGGNWLPQPSNTLYVTEIKVGLFLGDIIFPTCRGFTMLYGLNTAIRRHVLEKIGGYHSGCKNDIDDQLISRKLSQNKLKVRRFKDCWNYHSSRRLQRGVGEIIRLSLSTFLPKVYQEKSI